MWARACLNDGLVYRLYLRAGEGMAEVRHLELPINTERSAIAQALITTRQEMQAVRGPRRSQAGPRQQLPAAEPVPPPAPPPAASPQPPAAPVQAPSAEAQMALF